VRASPGFASPQFRRLPIRVGVRVKVRVRVRIRVRVRVKTVFSLVPFPVFF